ncbi:MAG TPA: hypothetical protein VIT23_16990, partial [Terrimicrobiaceae bacterium]
MSAIFGDNSEVIFDFANSPAHLDVLSGNSFLEVTSIQNAQDLVVKGGGAKKGGGRLTLLRGDSNIAGTILLQGAKLYLSGSACLPSVKELSLGGHESMIVFKNETNNTLDQFPDSAPIFTSGRAEIRLDGGPNPLSEETIGKVSLLENCVELRPLAREGHNAVLTVAEIDRQSDAILIIGYDRADGSTQLKLLDDKNIIEAQVGANGAEGATSASIVPWARGHGGGNQYGAAGFLTYKQSEGFHELSKEQEYALDLNASKPSDNVRVNVDAVNLSESKTVNSLYLDAPEGERDFGDSGLRQGGLDLGGNTLTVSSGAISLGPVGQITNGALTTGSDRPLVISGPIFLNGQLTGNGGLVYFGGRFPDLKLGGTENTLTGDYVIAYGAIRLGDGENIPNEVTVRLHKNTELYVAASETFTGLAGAGHVRLVTPGRSTLMLGSVEGAANSLAVGDQGEIRPGDVSKTQPLAGDLCVWNADDSKEYGSLNFQGGTLYIDLAEKAHDALVL